MSETHRVVALEPVSRAVSAVREPRRTADLIGRILTVLAAVAGELRVNAVIALTSELIG